MYDFANGPIAKELNSKAEKVGIKIIEYSFMGTRHMTANIKVLSPKDLQGVKIRAIPTPISMANCTAFGATPTPVAWEELYGALESGLVEGQENPVAEIIDMKFYQVQKYLMLTGHQRMFTVHAMSKKTWDKLPKDVQNVISETMADMVYYNEGLVKEKTRKGLQFLKTKLTIIDADSGLDLGAFRQKALAEIPPKFQKDWGDLYQRIYKSLYEK
jgi:TRAP-type C4-dicarboxylate transport system substrate-binding protein